VNYDHEKNGRWTSTARTWVQKAVARLAYTKPTIEAQRGMLSYEANRLLDTMLWEGRSLVPLLTEQYEIEELEKLARGLVQELRNHRLRDVLSNTTGRTPEEAQTFRDKAARLGSGSLRVPRV